MRASLKMTFEKNMQFAKDSFYMALRERLAALNPGRTVSIGGITRPVILVVENEPVSGAEAVADAFHIYWGAARANKQNSGGERPLLTLECTVAYRTGGNGAAGADRGRSLGQLDEELLAICRPGWTGKRDYRQSPPVELGTNVVWAVPELGEIEAVGEAPSNWRKARAIAGGRLQRLASLSLYFFAEAERK